MVSKNGEDIPAMQVCAAVRNFSVAVNEAADKISELFNELEGKKEQ